MFCAAGACHCGTAPWAAAGQPAAGAGVPPPAGRGELSGGGASHRGPMGVGIGRARGALWKVSTRSEQRSCLALTKARPARCVAAGPAIATPGGPSGPSNLELTVGHEQCSCIRKETASNQVGGQRELLTTTIVKVPRALTSHSAMADVPETGVPRPEAVQLLQQPRVLLVGRHLRHRCCGGRLARSRGPAVRRRGYAFQDP